MKAIIHIGTPKSGTTTIQSFLALNRTELISQGIRLEPMTPRYKPQMELALTGLIRSGGTLNAANKLYSMGFRNRAQQVRHVDQFEDMLRKGVAQWPEHSYIGSSEQIHAWLNTPERASALHGFLSSIFDEVRYIVYYRRQEDFILSTYSERIRRGENVNFQQHFDERLENMDFYASAKRWSQSVGRENLDVRLFDRSFLHNGDLLDDFCLATGIDRQHLETPSRQNQSLSTEEMELKLRLFAKFPRNRASGRPSFTHHGLAYLLGRKLPKPGTRMSLTNAQSRRITQYYERSNEQLRAEFFPDRAELFPTP